MRVLVLGAFGMLGHKVVQRLSKQYETTGSYRTDPQNLAAHVSFRDASLMGRVHAENFDSIVQSLADTRPDVIVNCIGIVKQKEEANLFVPSIEINALFPHRLAQLCQAAGARLIHFGTDCVFSGSRGKYTEDDVPDPSDLYGRSKLLGEVGGPGILTIRSSLIGRELVGCQGLVEWFVSQRGGSVDGYSGAIYSGLTSIAMADLVAELLSMASPIEGVWQVASDPISKYDMLVLLDRALDLKIDLRRETSFRCNRSLDGSRFRDRTGWRAPSWIDMLDALAADPTPYS